MVRQNVLRRDQAIDLFPYSLNTRDHASQHQSMPPARLW